MSIVLDAPRTTDTARTLRADLVERAAKLRPLLAGNADATTAGILDVEPGTALLKIVRLSLSGDPPVEWCSSLYRTDRYTLKTHVERAAEQSAD